MQPLDGRHRGFELGDPVGEPFLQRQHAHADVQPRAQFLRIERLDEIVVGARVQALDDVGAAVARA